MIRNGPLVDTQKSATKRTMCASRADTGTPRSLRGGLEATRALLEAAQPSLAAAAELDAEPLVAGSRAGPGHPALDVERRPRAGRDQRQDDRRSPGGELVGADE